MTCRNAINMRILGINTILIFILLLSSCTDPCYRHFTDLELQFVSYDKNESLSLIDTNNVVQTMHQTKYRRELFESCGSVGCSGENLELYEIGYRSNTNPDWGFNLNLYTESCNSNNNGVLFISSDNISSYKADRWIFYVELDLIEIKYDSIMINGVTYYNVYEFSGYHNDEIITMLFNHQFGILQITFPRNKAITLI